MALKATIYKADLQIADDGPGGSAATRKETLRKPPRPAKACFWALVIASTANSASGASLSGWITRSSASSSVRTAPEACWSETSSWAISSSRKARSSTRLRSGPW